MSKQITSLIYRKTGGFVGAFKGCELELSELPAHERERVLSLLEDSRLLSLKSHTQPHASDVYYYVLTATTSDGKEHEAKFDDITLPPKLRPLVRYLEGKSTDLRRSTAGD